MARLLRCQIVRWVSDDNPGWVEARFTDAAGSSWSIVDKEPIFTSEHLDSRSTFPLPGWMRCEVLGERRLSTGSRVVRAHLIDAELEDGRRHFDVLADQVIDTPVDMAEAIRQLRSIHRPPPWPARLPSPYEIAAAEARLGLEFEPDFQRFLADAGDVVVGTLEVARVTPDAGHLDLVETAEEAWEAGVPREWLPFCEDNGNYYCLVARTVRYWAHDGMTDEAWPDIATWIVDVWIGERS